MAIEVISHVEWLDRAVKRYGKDPTRWEFKCPSCGHVQSIAAAVERGLDIDPVKAKDWIYFSCEGRHNADVGCDWTLGGLFTIHEREVESPEPGEKRTAVMLFGDENYSYTPGREPAEAKAALPYVEVAGYRLRKLELADTKIGTTEYYHFHFKPSGWAIFTVNNETGEFSIQSDWGNYSHRWSPDSHSLGAPDLAHFLSRGDADYVVRKLAYNCERTFREEMNEAETERDLRKSIIDARREGRLDKEEAANLWYSLRDVDFSTIDAFVSSVGQLDELHDFLGHEPWEYVKTRPSHAYCFLREILLPWFFRWLREHIRETRRAAS